MKAKYHCPDCGHKYKIKGRSAPVTWPDGSQTLEVSFAVEACPVCASAGEQQTLPAPPADYGPLTAYLLAGALDAALLARDPSSPTDLPGHEGVLLRQAYFILRLLHYMHEHDHSIPVRDTEKWLRGLAGVE